MPEIEKQRLLPLLERYGDTMLPMHMPGDKRNFASALRNGALTVVPLYITWVPWRD